MDIMEAMRQRHSVRSYREIAIPQEVRGQLRAKITEANRESGLHVQLVSRVGSTPAGWA